MSRRISQLSIFLFIADLLIVVAGLWMASRLRASLPFGQEGALPAAVVEVPLYVYALALLCWGFGLSASGAYDPQRVLRWFNELWRVVAGSVLGTTLMAGTLFMSFRELSRLQFVYFFFVTLITLTCYRGALRAIYRVRGRTRPGGGSKVLIVGAGGLGARVANLLLARRRWGYQPIGFLDDGETKLGRTIQGLPVHGGVDQVKQVVRSLEADEVWITLPAYAQELLERIVVELERLPVRIKVVPDYFSLALVRAQTEVLGGIPVIGLRDPLIQGTPRLIKRLFDIAVTLVSLVVALPLMAVLALLIKLDSKGPALLRQQRVGENGRLFEMYKFRTMVSGAEKELDQLAERSGDEPVVHKRRDDPRVTRAGRWLRRFSMDELPQLINVLKGDMSLVGPRPEMPWLVDRYESWQRKRFAVPQGLTGWWQINGRSDKPMHLNTEDDLYYIYNNSLLLDLWILLRTPIAVLRGKGAF